MPGKAVALLVALICGIGSVGYILSIENTANFQWVKTTFAGGKNGGLTYNHRKPALGSKPEPVVLQAPPDDALKFRLASVAEQFSKNTRYSTRSLPVSQAQAQGYQGNRYQPVKIPLGSGGYFIAIIEKFRFTRGEPILVVTSLQGPQVIGNSLHASLEHPQTGDAVTTTTLRASESPGYFEGALDSDQTPGEYRLAVEAQVDGKPVRHVSTLTVEPYLGEFNGLGTPYVDNNNLVIPVQFSPEEAGVYGLSAQLYDGGRSIAHLQSEQRMDAGADTIWLRVHGTVLENRENQGQMQLLHLQIRQLPAAPGKRTNYAFGPEEGYSFSPPDLGGLHDAPTGDFQSEQRAALLRQLANKF